MQNKFQFPFHMKLRAVYIMLTLYDEICRFLALGILRQEKNMEVNWLLSITSSHHHFHILMLHRRIIISIRISTCFWDDFDLQRHHISIFLLSFSFLLLFSSSNGNMWFCNHTLSCARPSLYVYTWESFVAIGSSRLVLHILATERSCPFIVSYGQHLANCCAGISTVSHGNIVVIDIITLHFRCSYSFGRFENIKYHSEEWIFYLSAEHHWQ